MSTRVAISLIALVVAACSNTAMPSVSEAPATTQAPPSSGASAEASNAPGSTETAVQDGGSGWQATATSHADQIGTQFVYHCPPDGVNWFIYGTDIYTHDSSVCTAAVHFGLITLEAGGEVVIEMRGGEESYAGTNRNGIRSQSYGSWPTSFTFEGSPTAWATPGVPFSPEPTTPEPVTPEPVTPEPGATGATAGEYLSADELIICLPLNRSRFAEYDSNGELVGVDVEIGEGIAAQLDREPQFIETLFDQLIADVEARQCDLTIGGQFITQSRLERIDMIPYREGTPHVVVPKGNPLAIDELTDLCGRSFAVVTGTVFVDMVYGVGDYEGQGLDARCSDTGAEPIDLREYDSQADAEQALADRDVDAYAGNDFVAVDQPDVYEVTVALPLVRNGIGHFLGAQTVDDEVRAALREMIDDGSYADILSRYGVPDVALSVRP